MRLAITAFIAGGSFLFFLPSVPEGWQWSALILLPVVLLGLFKLENRSYLQYCCLAIAFATLGFSWNTHYAQQRLKNVLLEEFEGKDLSLEGRVDALPQGTAAGAKFAFEVQSAYFSGEKLEQFPQRIYLSWQPAWRNAQAIPIIIPGQRWKFKTKLKRPYGSLNPYTFDFERWAFHQNFGASGSIKSGQLLVQSDIGLFDIELAMEYQRWKLREKILRLLSPEAAYAGVLVALVMGDQNAIHQDDWRVFNATGIGHLISISGLHVTMLSGLGAALAARLWRRKSLPLLFPVGKVAACAGFLTAFVYAWLAGFQIPAQRTMYMVGVVAFALWAGRNPRSFDIWWWALAFVLVVDPMAPYTPGFWLSFGAVAAILFAMGNSAGLLGIPTGKELEVPWTQRVLQALREACRVQAVVTIALLPCTLFWFYQASVVSPLANAFAIPIVSYIVTPLALSGALLPEFIAKYLLLLAHATMEHLAVVLRWFASWEWAVAWSHQPPWWALAIAGLGIVIVIRPGVIRETCLSRLGGLCLVGLVFIRPNLGAGLELGEFRATVLDIGQGTSVLIETATKRLLYDTGPINGKKDDAGNRVIVPYLRGRGIDQIDRMVISHSDSDHIGGAATLLKEIRFDSMMGTLPSDHSLLENFKSRRIAALPCRHGQSWVWDGVEFYIWHPHENTLFVPEYPAKPNEMSCVLEVRNPKTSFWLTGDVERQGEAELAERLDVDALAALEGKELILMAPHHGSKTSSSEVLLKRLNPDLAFAQNGYKNRYGHPHPTVLARYLELGIPFYQSPKTGAQIWTFTKQTNTKIEFWRERTRRLWHRAD